MSNCSRHKKEVAGISDMKVLAEMIGDLHYESLAELFRHLPNVFEKLSDKDYKDGKNALGFNQNEIQNRLRHIQPFTERLWQISKPFMEENPQTENK